MKHLSKPKYCQFVLVCMVAVGALFVCLISACAQVRRTDAPPVRPRRVPDAQAANIVTVRAGDNLQAAVNAAHFGDTILLAAGATYTGPLLLPFKGTGTGSDADYITIRTADLAGIPAEGARVQPDLHARAMPKLVAPDNQPALATAPQAHHYKFIGVEFAPAANVNYLYNLIDLGASDYTALMQVPHHLLFDRCYVHSTGLNKARRGFALNSAETSILNSYVAGFAGAGDETQAIAGWNGPGPFHIVNNYIEGACQNIMFGGADPSLPDLVPTNIEIRRNYLYKPAAWFGRASIKADIELKNARHVVIDGNVIENGGVVGPFVITVRNQNGKAPWSTIEDVTVTNNIVRHAGTGFSILGRDNEHPSQQAKRIRIANNLLLDLQTANGDAAIFVKLCCAVDVTVEHNSVQQTGNIITSYGEPTTNFIFRNNIVQHNLYGFYCEGGPVACISRATFKGNVIADNADVAARGESIDRNIPLGNFFAHTYEDLKFLDYAHGDWRLTPQSRYRGRAADGEDPGVDYAALEAAGALSAAAADARVQ
ncbi:MAG: hypothetical protein ACJ74W_10825 [Pyrinomonadaceae bacterium]